ncbi:MAG: hypothetical protein HY482_00265 [Candidatus Wildermuthbacteria bacterium]|nr:hypothetical protein [Candidatus Wildermuthbacteria bacterium]
MVGSSILPAGTTRSMPIRKAVTRNFFCAWSRNMAYVLGFFLADGSMNQNSRGAYFIEFEITDKLLLHDIRRVLGSNHKISVRKKNNAKKFSYRLQIGSKELFSDLMRLGVSPGKTARLKFPQVPEAYASDFVRDYFDGDGHVTISTYRRAARNNRPTRVILSGFTCANQIFITQLHAFLKKYANIQGGSVFYNKGSRLTFAKNDTLALYRFLYKNIDTSLLYLSRKREIFRKYFKGL